MFITLTRATKDGKPIGQIVINPEEILYMTRNTSSRTFIKFKRQDEHLFVIEGMSEIQEKILKKRMSDD